MPINYQAPIQVRDNRNGSWFWVHTHVWRDAALGHADKVVYGTLASYSNNDSQQSFPSIETIAKDSGVSERHAYRCIKSLEKNGYLLVKRKQGKPNVYILVKTTPDIMSPLTKDTVGGDKSTVRTRLNNKTYRDIGVPISPSSSSKKALKNSSKRLTKRDSSNAKVSYLLKIFRDRWGEPADRVSPRRVAWNVAVMINSCLKRNGVERSQAEFEQLAFKLIDWVFDQEWGEDVQTMGAIRGHGRRFLSEYRPRKEVRNDDPLAKISAKKLERA